MNSHTKVIGVVVDYNWGLRTLAITDHHGELTTTIPLDAKQTPLIESFINKICGCVEDEQERGS